MDQLGEEVQQNRGAGFRSVAVGVGAFPQVGSEAGDILPPADLAVLDSVLELRVDKNLGEGLGVVLSGIEKRMIGWIFNRHC